MGGKITGQEVNLSDAVDGTDDPNAAVPHSALLCRFAEAAVMSGDKSDLPNIRNQIVTAFDLAAVVDCAGIVAHYEKMDRIADSIGLPLDAPMRIMAGDLREELNLSRFASAENTAGLGIGMRLLGSFLRRIAPMLMKFVSRKGKN
ncbi:MAG: hypothetical protein OXC05_13050 [Halieaceae bacterium]|nr:hypothetical protein [Halieaceae bacterium]